MNWKDKLLMAAGVILVLQGFFPEGFEWPTTSVGWVRFLLAVSGAVLTAVAGTDATGPADPA